MGQMDFSKIFYGEILFVPAKTNSSLNNHINNNCNNNSNQLPEEFQAPRYQLCDPNLIQLSWLQSEKVGGGLINVGNTCFLNSVLQCLTYCPPLYNFLVKHNGGHSQTCKLNQFCMLCEMEKVVKRIRSSNGGAIKPVSIVQRLKYINKSFQFGRQEDAHEFLRYLIDHMWKACLMNLDINSKTTNNNLNGNSNNNNNNQSNGNTSSINTGNKLDPRIKETTFINHIFGGYHRSQVLCLTCNSRSNTFDYFMDLILDIRNAKSLEEGLKKFTQAETLQNENAYKCGKCRKKVVARKKFTVFKAPNVATFQFKRFDSDRIFGGKVTKFISYPEELDLRPYMSDPTKSPIKYQLSGVLVHVGHSSNSGHYFCFIRNSNNFWYRMDDSNVSMVTQATALQQQAYVLFYTRKTSDLKHSSNGIASVNTSYSSNGTNSSNTTTATTTTTKSHTSTNNNHINHNNNSPSISSTNNHHHNNHNNGNSSGSSSNTNNHNNNNGVNNQHQNNGNYLKNRSTLATWHGSRSKLDEDEMGRKKFNEMTERDMFNEELDQGKIKKMKSRSRDDRFSQFSRSNPFQRFTSNGYQQYKRMRRL